MKVWKWGWKGTFPTWDLEDTWSTRFFKHLKIRTGAATIGGVASWNFFPSTRCGIPLQFGRLLGWVKFCRWVWDHFLATPKCPNYYYYYSLQNRYILEGEKEAYHFYPFFSHPMIWISKSTDRNLHFYFGIHIIGRCGGSLRTFFLLAGGQKSGIAVCTLLFGPFEKGGK